MDVLGSFPAPEGPPWGWRTVVAPTADGFALRMYVIPPGEAEQLAFENIYVRA